jgi:hypothetical protein
MIVVNELGWEYMILEAVALNAGKKLATDAVTKLLNEQLGRRDETLTLLKSVAKDIDSILHGPFYTAMVYIEEARTPSHSPAQRIDDLVHARHELIRALGQEHDLVTHAEVAFNLALLWMALESVGDARRFARQANKESVQGVAQLVHERNDHLKSKWKQRAFIAIPPGEEAEFLDFRGQFSRLTRKHLEMAQVAESLGIPRGELCCISIANDRGKEIKNPASFIAGNIVTTARNLLLFKGDEVNPGCLTTAPNFTFTTTPLPDSGILGARRDETPSSPFAPREIAPAGREDRIRPPRRNEAPSSPFAPREIAPAGREDRIRPRRRDEAPDGDTRRIDPGITRKEHRVAPRHAAVWVRIGGEWRRGRIIEWVRQIDRDGWDCVIIADESVTGPPRQGRYPFDPKIIRARDTDQPPAASQ